MEDKFLKELNIEAMDILDDTPIEDVVDYYFKLLVNNNIKKLNNKIEQKSKKEDIKDAEFEVTNFTAAVKLYGAEVKALKKIVKSFIEDLNPNKKEPKRDIVLEGTVESYDKILSETKRMVFKETKEIE